MEIIELYKTNRYKHRTELHVIVDSENYELAHIENDVNKALEIAIQVLLKEKFVKVILGPGPWLTLDLNKGVDPKGEYHSDKIPPFFWETLDDETREKLK